MKSTYIRHDEEAASPLADPAVPAYVRRKFYMRVMLLLAAQLAVTAGTASAMRACAPLRDASMQAAPWVMPLSIVGVIASGCFSGVTSSAGTALALLFTFTMCESILIGYATMQVPIGFVAIAAGGTALFFVASCVFVQRRAAGSRDPFRFATIAKRLRFVSACA